MTLSENGSQLSLPQDSASNSWTSWIVREIGAYFRIPG